MIVRPFQPSDAPALAAIFADAIRTTAAQYYPRPLLDAWARAAEDIGAFGTILERGVTLIAEGEQALAVAFGQLDPKDHLSMIYCRGAHARQGHASRIYEALEIVARNSGTTVLRTEASIASHPFFRKHGFHDVEVERVIRFGEQFDRFKMAKPLNGANSRDLRD